MSYPPPPGSRSRTSSSASRYTPEGYLQPSPPAQAEQGRRHSGEYLAAGHAGQALQMPEPYQPSPLSQGHPESRPAMQLVPPQGHQSYGPSSSHHLPYPTEDPLRPMDPRRYSHSSQRSRRSSHHSQHSVHFSDEDRDDPRDHRGSQRRSGSSRRSGSQRRYSASSVHRRDRYDDEDSDGGERHHHHHHHHHESSSNNDKVKRADLRRPTLGDTVVSLFSGIKKYVE